MQLNIFQIGLQCLAYNQPTNRLGSVKHNASSAQRW